jgi:hypothetical protein
MQTDAHFYKLLNCSLGLLLKKAGDVFLVEAVVAKVGDSVSDSAAGGAAAVVEGLGRNRPLQIHEVLI